VTQRGKSILWIAGVIVAAIVFAVYFRGTTAPPSGPAALAGQQAPSFTVPQLGGGSSELAAHRGRVLVMNLWATWCPPCRAEMPDLQRLYESYKNKNVDVLGVDQGESAARVGAFAKSLGIHYPILLDQDQQYGRVYAALGLPTTIIVDPQGVVTRAFDGPLSYSQMVDAISPLLGKRS
jgi:peroxiredoxin